MKLKIYQIAENADEKNLKFKSLSELRKEQGGDEIDSGIYTRVFTGDIDEENLEDVFKRFNVEYHPLFRGHSMSVSDIAVTEDGEFYCDDSGFKKIEFDENKTIPPENVLRAVYVEPNRPAYETEIENTLKALQRAVGGYIEAVSISDGISLVCNEEGKLDNLPGNRRIGNDIIAGAFVIVGNGEEDFRSLTDEETNRYLKEFARPEEISEKEVKNSIRAGVITFN